MLLVSLFKIYEIYCECTVCGFTPPILFTFAVLGGYSQVFGVFWFFIFHISMEIILAIVAGVAIYSSLAHANRDLQTGKWEWKFWN